MFTVKDFVRIKLLKICISCLLPGFLQLLLFVSAGMPQEINKDAQLYYTKGIQADNLSEKIKYFDKAVEVDPYYDAAFYQLGRCYFQKGKFRKAISYFNKINPSDSTSKKQTLLYLRNAYTFHAKALNEQGKIDSALTSAKSALKIDPNFAPALTISGLIYFKKKNWQSALDVLEKSVQHNAMQELAWARLGDLYLRREDFPQAVRAYEQALAIDSNLHEVQENLEIAEARNRPEVWLERADELLGEQDFEAGIELLQQAATIYPENREINHKLRQIKQERNYLQGMQALENENWHAALDIFQQIDPEYQDTALKLEEARAEIILANLDSLNSETAEEELPPGAVKPKPQPEKITVQTTSRISSVSAQPEKMSQAPETEQVVKDEEQQANIFIVTDSSDIVDTATLPDTFYKDFPVIIPQPEVPQDFVSSSTDVESGGSPLTPWLIGIAGIAVLVGLATFKATKRKIKKPTTANKNPLQETQTAKTTDELFQEKIASETPAHFEPIDTTLFWNKNKKANLPEMDEEIEALSVQETKTLLGGVRKVKRIGRYIIEKEIGRGSMGLIYKAWDPKLDRTVVVKQVCFDPIGSDHEITRLKERLYREARAAAKLNHPNIVVVYDVEEDASSSYIVMEYLDGKDLDYLLEKEGRFTPEGSLKIVVQICSALDFAHQNGIVHRDIKPSNIMLTPKNVVKVADFGIAKLPQFGTLTLTGAVLGTPFYMSPEQIEGRKLDGRSDIFSVGVVLYELLTGVRPFAGDNIPSVVYKIVHQIPPAPSCLDKRLLPELDAIVERALAKDPENRYPTAHALMQELEMLQEKVG